MPAASHLSRPAQPAAQCGSGLNLMKTPARPLYSLFAAGAGMRLLLATALVACIWLVVAWAV